MSGNHKVAGREEYVKGHRCFVGEAIDHTPIAGFFLYDYDTNVVYADIQEVIRLVLPK